MLRTTGTGSPLHNRSLVHRSSRTTEVLKSSPNISVMGVEAVAAASLTRGETREVCAWNLGRDIKPVLCQSPEHLRVVAFFPRHTVT